MEEFFRSHPTRLSDIGYWKNNFYLKDISMREFLAAQITNRVKIEFRSNEDLMKMFDYMLETVEDMYGLTESELGNHIINTRWGAIIDVDMLLEHAIVHLLRHRRQLEKFKHLYFS